MQIDKPMVELALTVAGIRPPYGLDVQAALAKGASSVAAAAIQKLSDSENLDEIFVAHAAHNAGMPIEFIGEGQNEFTIIGDDIAYVWMRTVQPDGDMRTEFSDSEVHRSIGNAIAGGCKNVILLANVHAESPLRNVVERIALDFESRANVDVRRTIGSTPVVTHPMVKSQDFDFPLYAASVRPDTHGSYELDAKALAKAGITDEALVKQIIEFVATDRADRVIAAHRAARFGPRLRSMSGYAQYTVFEVAGDQNEITRHILLHSVNDKGLAVTNPEKALHAALWRETEMESGPIVVELPHSAMISASEALAWQKKIRALDKSHYSEVTILEPRSTEVLQTIAANSLPGMSISR